MLADVRRVAGTQGGVDRIVGTGASSRRTVLALYTALPYIRSVFSFIETRLFTRLVQEYLSDEQYGVLQQTLMQDPEAGPVVPGSGGVRKLRWAAPGRGKRGGYRVIYYVRRTHGVIWMLTMYPKNVAESIAANVLRQIREEVEND